MSLGRMFSRQLSPVTDRVFLTGVGGVSDAAMLLDAKVTHVLNLAAELSHLTYPENVEVRYVTLRDTESENILPYLDSLADYVHEVVTSGGQGQRCESQCHEGSAQSSKDIDTEEIHDFGEDQSRDKCDVSKFKNQDGSLRGPSFFGSPADKREKDNLDAQGRIVVHCVAGVSRSASVCIAYLIKHHGMTLRQAHDRVKAVREVISPNIGFWGALIEYEYQIRGSNTVELLPYVAGTIPSIDSYRKEMMYRIRLGWMDHVFFNVFVQIFFLIAQMLGVYYFQYDFS